MPSCSPTISASRASASSCSWRTISMRGTISCLRCWVSRGVAGSFAQRGPATACARGRSSRSGGRGSRNAARWGRRVSVAAGRDRPAVRQVCRREPLAWRDASAHRPPGALVRVLEEVANAGVRQVILVTAAEEIGGPHALSIRRATPRGRARRVSSRQPKPRQSATRSRRRRDGSTRCS